jgi:hypothetical protein
MYLRILSAHPECSDSPTAEASHGVSGQANGARGAIIPAWEHGDFLLALPQNAEAERSVLGAILVNNQALYAAREKLQPDDFCDERHKRLFKYMIALNASGTGIDLITLTDSLRTCR